MRFRDSSSHFDQLKITIDDDVGRESARQILMACGDQRGEIRRTVDGAAEASRDDGCGNAIQKRSEFIAENRGAGFFARETSLVEGARQSHREFQSPALSVAQFARHAEVAPRLGQPNAR
jgi:hypothetical protein